MQDRFINELFAATDKMFRTMGVEKFEDGMAEMADFVVKVGKVMTIMKSRAGTRRWLKKFPDPDPTEFAQVVNQLPKLAYSLRRLAPQAVKVLPHAPGGRPIKINPERYRQICMEISNLFLKGVPLGIAQERVAQRYGVNLRTIQRVWRDRKRL